MAGNYNQPPRFTFIRQRLGDFYLGLLLWESSRVFNQMIHQGFVNAFLTSIGEEFRAQITTKVGGGYWKYVLSTYFSNFRYRRFRSNILLMMVGVLMICNVKFATLLSGFQKGSQLVIEKNKDAGDALKNKYNDLVETKA